jgi:hypothetical protein
VHDVWWQDTAVSTMMTCAEPNMAQEQAVLADLTQTIVTGIAAALSQKPSPGYSIPSEQEDTFDSQQSPKKSAAGLCTGGPLQD